MKTSGLTLGAKPETYYDQGRPELVEMLPRCPERTVALRKLLEGKDCAVRAALWKAPPA